MGGMNDFYGDDFGHQAQNGQYWSQNASCEAQYARPQYAQPEYTQNACGTSYSVAQNGHVTQPYAAQSVAPSPYAAAPTPSYASQLHGTQPYLENTASYPAYQAQQGFQGEYAPAYVSPQPHASKGLRQAYTYGTLGATLYDVDSDLYGIQGRLGWQSDSIFGVEVEGSYGFNEDDATVDFGAGPVAAESGVETQIAGFGVLRYPVSNRLNVLTRVGYHSTEFEAEFDDGTTVLEQDFSTDGIAYGVGVEYALSHNTAVRADYTRYDLDGPEADALSLAIARKF